jgi:hypothetical protein
MALRTLFFLALCLSVALSCWIPPPGKKACTAAKCGQITGYYAAANNATTMLLPGASGGTNYEFYTTLIPSTTFADPVTAEKIPYVQFLQQTTASTFSQCCSACASLQGCQVWRHFPVSST